MRIIIEWQVRVYQVFVEDFEMMLRDKYKHGDFAHDESATLIADLWDAWHELKADLPRGGE